MYAPFPNRTKGGNMGYNTYTYKDQVDRCMQANQQGIPIAVIDLETTGRSANKNYIFEFAGIKILFDKDLNAKVVDNITLLIKPAEPLSKKISDLTGFTNDVLVNRPTEKESFGRIFNFMNNTILCSHNTAFEKGFMEAMYNRQNKIFIPIDIIDTLKMSRDLNKEEKSHKLSDVAERYGIADGVKFHDARDDTLVCAKLLSRFINEYADVDYSSQYGKDRPIVFSIQYWEGKRHDQKRLYIQTDRGTLWWSCFNKTWGEKDKGIIDLIDMCYLEKRVLEMTKCSNFDELADFKGAVQ